MENLPSDPAMLLSVVNTRLRDNYASLDELCDDLHLQPLTTPTIPISISSADFPRRRQSERIRI